MLSQLLLLVYLCLSWPLAVSAISAARLAELRNATTQVFHHGWDNYMRIAFPEDELRPISCTPLTRDPANPGNYDLNDVLGNYSLTLIDSLSTLAILAGTPSDENTAVWALQEFQQSVAAFVEYYGDGRRGPSGEGLRARGFDLDSKVQVFETVIRGVGGLLSAHLFAIGDLPIPGYNPGHVPYDEESDPLELPPIAWPNGFKYDGQLLRLALDLAERLLPAFYTKTGLPYPRVNLRHGIPFYVNSPLHKVSRDGPDSPRASNEKTDTCSAGAGSLVLEFTVLSRLTDDPRFEQLAKRAFWAVWKAKSDIGLIGNAIDPEKGEWVSFDSGIGAGVDSFFEYALKSHILLSGHELPNVTVPEPPTDRQWLDPNTIHDTPLTPEENSAGAFLEAWHHAHAAIKRHLYNDAHHPYYMTGHRTRGYAFTSWIDSLAAFYPGLLAMAGEIDEAQEANLLYTALWTRYGALPERWSVRERQVDSGIGWWPGRPEFIESNYYLYRATNDPWYVHVGEMVLTDIKRLCHTKCGWSGLQNVDTGEKADRMQSFFLGETTKYLYLLFDPDHPLNKLDAAYVFTTEAHPLIIPRRRTKRRKKHDKKQKSHAQVRNVNVYYDENFTNTCPAPAKEVPLTGSALAARTDVFHAASFVNLHTISNPHSGIESVPGSNDSISRYKANHVFFPWTLPRSLIPENGICAALPFKPTLIIEFPSSIQQSGVGSAFNSLFSNTAAFKTPVGVRISALNGLKIHFVQEESFDSTYDHTWRVTQVNHMPLGRDEPVHIDADLLNGISDPLFNRVRYNGFIELILMHGEPADHNASAPLPAEGLDLEFDDADDHLQLTEEARSELREDQAAAKSMNTAYRSMLKSMIRAVTSVFDPTNTPAPRPAGAQPKFHVESYMGSLGVGKGAVPLPDTPDSSIPSDDAAPNLPWQTVYRAGYGCDGRLPDEAPRHHQVIVMRRGGCSFSEKLANIPSFTPSSHALQLVIIVDEEELENNYVYGAPDMWEYELIKPHLDVEQTTPSGLRRPHPIAMVMVRGGGPEAYEKFGNALGVGVRRKYFIETQGRRVDNIIVL
ncbi:ER degradation-enhancing alpha-mannosidase-like protein 1 [Colletotrichum chlorophyti]|uniref:alpha-1,2-Mannosidase n=1 Tax=Colletotrichum chlorophyti TaxID=708187 RepID=A0A1Q8REU1_9PEZI|nr:ER degradation-enhancing alpha-mannosidase-like protein 1 [Colletotrichum chlorophyti]